MMDWLTEFFTYLLNWLTAFFTNLTWRQVVFGLLMFVVSFTASLALVSFVLVRLPAMYFHSSYAREFLVDRHRAIRWGGIVLKNLTGLFLILLGVILSLPGVPGQGFLTILLGLIMLDIPGKRPLETKLVKRPKVLHSINRLRAKFDKPPLIID
jgi:hypothetical protein